MFGEFDRWRSAVEEGKLVQSLAVRTAVVHEGEEHGIQYVGRVRATFHEDLLLRGRRRAATAASAFHHLLRCRATIFQRTKRKRAGSSDPARSRSAAAAVETERRRTGAPPSPIGVLPLDSMLERIATVMAIYCQNSLTGVMDYAGYAAACRQRLTSAALSNAGDATAARFCVIAWELAAVAAQRWQPKRGLEYLRRINALLDARRLWDALPVGDERIIRRMMHWGLIVAPGNIDDVMNQPPQSGTRLDAEIPDKTRFDAFAANAEPVNANVHRVAELLRSAESRRRNGALDDAVGIFHEELYRPLLKFAYTDSSARRGGMPARLR